MMREWADATMAVARHLEDAVVGWHTFGESSVPSRLWLLLSGSWLEVCTAGDGSLQLAISDEPADFDMDEAGRLDIRPVDPVHPLHRLLGSQVVRIRDVTWRGARVGLVVETTAGAVLLANDGDEVFASGGALPPDYTDAVIED